MLATPPTAADLCSLLGHPLHTVWTDLCARIDEAYDMDHFWNNGGKSWTYEYKYRRGGKTLCTLYAREKQIGFLIILGKAEREKYEAGRQDYTPTVQKFYDAATTYHDGKWILFEPTDTTLFDDFLKLLQIKRKSNKK